MRHHRVVAFLLLAGSILTPALSAAPAGAASGTRQVTSSGLAQLVSRPDGAEGGVANPELATTPDDARESGSGGRDIKFRNSAPRVAAANRAAAPSAASPLVSSSSNVKTSFDGLNHRNQRLANGGNQFSLEPPDQGLCIGNGRVVEALNDIVRVYRDDGTPLTGVVDLNTFLGYPAQFNRTTGLQGPFVTDPSCWFDSDVQRFFLLVLTLEVFPETGDFTGENHMDLAVSLTNDPTDGWKIFRINVTDDGKVLPTDRVQQTTPDHGCPPSGKPFPPDVIPPTHPNACIGDFPHIGADKVGIYLTTNEYCLFCPETAANPSGFRAAQIYALNKRALQDAPNSIAVTQIDTQGMQAGKPGFTLWPATSPTGFDDEDEASGTEYFTSSNAAEEVSNVPNSKGTNKSDEIVVWALTNTFSIKTDTPALRLKNTTVNVDQYKVPGPSNQKAGPFPLGQCLNDTTMPTPFGPGCWQIILLKEPPHNNVEGPLDSSDSRVLSTRFAHGRLWGTLDTPVSVGGKTKSGVLFYVIRPQVNDAGDVRAKLLRQGHVAVPNNNAIYGSVAATDEGKAVLGFTLVGDSHYPSAAYVSLNEGNPGPVHVIAESLGPQDGFTEYDVFSRSGTARPRWGDYGASVATDDNTIWVANEYIAQTCTLQQYANPPTFAGFGSCGGTRTVLGNWGTRLSAINVE